MPTYGSLDWKPESHSELVRRVEAAHRGVGCARSGAVVDALARGEAVGVFWQQVCELSIDEQIAHERFAAALIRADILRARAIAVHYRDAIMGRMEEEA